MKRSALNFGHINGSLYPERYQNLPIISGYYIITTRLPSYCVLFLDYLYFLLLQALGIQEFLNSFVIKFTGWLHIQRHRSYDVRTIHVASSSRILKCSLSFHTWRLLSDCRTVDVACRHVWKLRLHACNLEVSWRLVIDCFGGHVQLYSGSVSEIYILWIHLLLILFQ
jgi:hypothetical protein